MSLKNIDLKKNRLDLARVLLACTMSGAKTEKLDVSSPLKRWRAAEKANAKSGHEKDVRVAH